MGLNEHFSEEVKVPWVSFCMSTYKRPDLLKVQLESILLQTFTDLEIVVSDNDPDASARAVVEKIIDKRIRYYHNSENLGMVKSFNNSLSKAKGTFVVMITDDDPVYPDMLETLHNLSIKYPGYGVYHGGCEILCYSPATAKVMRSKVGINSCLSNELNYNEEKVYSAQEFPYLFFKYKLGALMLWSVGIVKREILVQNAGMPDYGTEYFTDLAYTVVNGSHSGMVYVNRALGHQAIHGDNFGFNQLKNLDKYLVAPDNFCNWVEDKMKNRDDWQKLKNELHSFIGRAIVEFSVFIKKSLVEAKLPDTDFQKATKKVFRIPYLRKWKAKYILLSQFPATFQYLLQLKQKLIK